MTKNQDRSGRVRLRFGACTCLPYRRVYGVDVEVTAVAARGDHVVDFADRHRIPRIYRSFGELIADGELDVVDICTHRICTPR